jgi:hypothetical protein
MLGVGRSQSGCSVPPCACAADLLLLPPHHGHGPGQRQRQRQGPTGRRRRGCGGSAVRPQTCAAAARGPASCAATAVPMMWPQLLLPTPSPGCALRPAPQQMKLCEASHCCRGRVRVPGSLQGPGSRGLVSPRLRLRLHAPSPAALESSCHSASPIWYSASPPLRGRAPPRHRRAWPPPQGRPQGSG